MIHAALSSNHPSLCPDTMQRHGLAPKTPNVKSFLQQSDAVPGSTRKALGDVSNAHRSHVKGPQQSAMKAVAATPMAKAPRRQREEPDIEYAPVHVADVEHDFAPGLLDALLTGGKHVPCASLDLTLEPAQPRCVDDITGLRTSTNIIIILM